MPIMIPNLSRKRCKSDHLTLFSVLPKLIAAPISIVEWWIGVCYPYLGFFMRSLLWTAPTLALPEPLGWAQTWYVPDDPSVLLLKLILF